MFSMSYQVSLESQRQEKSAAPHFPSTEAELASALTYRFRRALESDEALAHELLSDIPHLRDFLNSINACAISLAALNLPALTQSAVALLFSGGGLAASIPNIIAIVHEKREERDELKKTLTLYDHFQERQNQQELNRDQTLELAGLPDTGVHTLDDQQLKKIRDYALKTRIQRAGATLRAPSWDVLKTGITSTCHFWYKTTKDIVLNVFSPRVRDNIDCTIAGLALWHKCRKERELLRGMAEMTTIGEKIERVRTYIDQPELLRSLQADIDTIGQPAIDHLTQMQKALRAKAQLLHTANHGFTLQSAFIACSFGMCILHLGKGNFAEAALQFAGGSLALNPLRFVGEQAHVLYQALHSERAEATQIEQKMLERLMPFTTEMPDSRALGL
jgi:hypothetical protein